MGWLTASCILNFVLLIIFFFTLGSMYGEDHHEIQRLDHDLTDLRARLLKLTGDYTQLKVKYERLSRESVNMKKRLLEVEPKLAKVGKSIKGVDKLPQNDTIDDLMIERIS